MKKIEKPNWEVRHYNELSTHELYEILKLRSEVFVVEQNCPYQDLDGLDCACYHVLGWHEENQELVAYARILPEGVDPYELVGEGDEHHGGIGRVVVAPQYRGIGHELMNHAIDAYHEKVGMDTPCIIHALAHLKNIYESHGFKQSSDLCIIDGINHIEMTLQEF
jgi:ElaA protein